MIGGPKLTEGGWLELSRCWAARLIFVVVLVSDWDLPSWSCIVRPVGGVGASGIMTTHNGWDTMLSLAKAGWDRKPSSSMKSVKRGMVVSLFGFGYQAVYV